MSDFLGNIIRDGDSFYCRFSLQELDSIRYYLLACRNLDLISQNDFDLVNINKLSTKLYSYWFDCQSMVRQVEKARRYTNNGN